MLRPEDTPLGHELHCEKRKTKRLDQVALPLRYISIPATHVIRAKTHVIRGFRPDDLVRVLDHVIHEYHT